MEAVPADSAITAFWLTAEPEVAFKVTVPPSVTLLPVASLLNDNCAADGAANPTVCQPLLTPVSVRLNSTS